MAPLPSFASAATGCRHVVVLSDCGAEEEKGKGKRKEEEEGEPGLGPVAVFLTGIDGHSGRHH